MKLNERLETVAVVDADADADVVRCVVCLLFQHFIGRWMGKQRSRLNKCAEAKAEKSGKRQSWG